MQIPCAGDTLDPCYGKFRNKALSLSTPAPLSLHLVGVQRESSEVAMAGGTWADKGVAHHAQLRHARLVTQDRALRLLRGREGGRERERGREKEREKNFSKVSALVYLLDKVTIESTL